MHHAYYFEGSLSQLAALVKNAQSIFNFTKIGDPDVRVLTFDKFGIDDAQTLRAQASFKSVSGRALFIIGISSVTTEAQQALLKLFEEPQPGTTFVLLVPHGALMPTLRSRFLPWPQQKKILPVHLGSSQRSRPGSFSAEAREFLRSSYKTRSAEVAGLLKDDEGTRERVRDFLQGVEVELYEHFAKSKGDKALRQGLEDVAKVRSYAGDRSPSFKMLLEHLAVTLPMI